MYTLIYTYIFLCDDDDAFLRLLFTTTIVHVMTGAAQTPAGAPKLLAVESCRGGKLPHTEM